MSSMPPVSTALDALHRSLGATMTDFAGWDMPLRYGSERDEHHAVRTTAGLFDLSHMGEITVTGPRGRRSSSTTRWSATSRTVGVGRARYTMICQEDGGILDDLIVYRLGETEYMVVANASNAQVVLDALDRARRRLRRRGPRRPRRVRADRRAGPGVARHPEVASPTPTWTA